MKESDINAAANGPPIVDVTMRVQEGKQYFVNRITFLGNTTTRDNVIRREIRLVEAGVFNTEALKYSVRRLNQLGYFKALEGDAIGVEKTPGREYSGVGAARLKSDMGSSVAVAPSAKRSAVRIALENP